MTKVPQTIFLKASKKADTPPVLFLKHTGTQLLQVASCLSISKLILLEATLKILPTWSLWSQNKYLGRFLGASSSFPSAGSGYLQDHLSLLELLIKELYCKLCKRENILSFLFFFFLPESPTSVVIVSAKSNLEFTACFHQCKLPMDTIHLHLFKAN